ncbi:ABC transporter ATP-binding protein [Deinococcus roseus]|nr:ABC transporter ATP-binding protein [Deinococcus roseus]
MLPLKVKDFSVKLQNRVIIERADFEVKKSEIVHLIGHNGAGKSTLLRGMIGLFPSKGEVKVAGENPRSIAGRKQFVYVPDEPALYEDLTLQEHVQYVAALYEKPEAPILEWLERFHLTDRLKDFPATHSRGMRQKLSLSLALGLNLPLTLLDEPYNALDQAAQEALSHGIRDAAQHGNGVLLSAHQTETTQILKAQVARVQDGMVSKTA